MNIAVWNVLHDGCIAAIEATVPGDLRLSVEIAYLCHHLPTQAGSLVVVLKRCERFEYRPYVEEVVSDPSEIAALELGILSAWVAEEDLRVACSDGGPGGELVLRYSSAEVSTAEGRLLTQAELESAAERYWAPFGEKRD